MTRLLSRLSLAVLFSSPCTALAQLRPEIVQKAREAIVQVEVEGVPERALAFAIDQDGHFVTAAGALRTPIEPPDEVQLTIDLAASWLKKPMARVRRVDRALGLAWLDLSPFERLNTSIAGRDRATLELGNDSGLVEGADVTIFEFVPDKFDAAEILMQAAKVVTLEREDNRLVRFGIDVPFKRELVGGPVLDRAGKVVGVITGPRPGTDRIAAVSVGRLAAFLSVPVIRYAGFFRGELDLSERSKPRLMSFLFDVPSVPGQAPVDVQVLIESAPGDRREFSANSTGSAYDFNFVPVPAANQSLALTVEFKSGAIQGEAADREIRVGERVLRLADVNRISLKPASKPAPDLLLKKDFLAIEGPITGLAPLTLMVEGTSIPINLDRALTIDVSPGKALPAPALIGCTVIARRGAVELGRRSFPLVFSRPEGGLPANRFSHLAAHPANANRGLELEPLPLMPAGARSAGASIKPPPIRRDRNKEIALEGIIGDVVTGGGGRYLLLVLRSNRKLAVFDVNEARIVGNIPLPAEDVLVAAGAENAFIFDPESKLLESWALKTRARIGARPFLTNCRVKNINLGSDSDGPLLVYWLLGLERQPRENENAPRNSDAPRGFVSLIDPGTLRVARFVDPNFGPVFDGPAAPPEAGEARTLPMAARIRFVPGFQRDRDSEVYRSHHIHVRASPDGKMFAIWGGERGEPRVVLVFDNKALQCFDTNPLGPTARILPGTVAGTIFSSAGIFDTQGQRRLDAPSRIFLPSNDPATFLALGGFDQAPPFYGERYRAGRRSCDIYLEYKTKPVMTLDNLDEMNAQLAPVEPSDLTLDKRFHYIPAARLLITIPASDDRLVLRHLDVLDQQPKVGLANATGRN
jgi:hypothetical protein